MSMIHHVVCLLSLFFMSSPVATNSRDCDTREWTAIALRYHPLHIADIDVVEQVRMSKKLELVTSKEIHKIKNDIVNEKVLPINARQLDLRIDIFYADLPILGSLGPVGSLS